MLDNNSINSREEDRISLREFVEKITSWWSFLLSKWVTILVVGLLGGALGLLYSFQQKMMFTATTTFVLEDGKNGGSGLGSLAGFAAMAGMDLNSGGGGIFQGDNILELYKSRNMIEKTLLTEVEIEGKRELLIDRYINFNKFREGWEKDSVLKTIKFTPYNEVDSSVKSKSLSRTKDSLIGVFVKSISKANLVASRPEKKLSIVEVKVVAPDEEFAKAFNDEIVKNVNKFYKDTKTKKSLQNVVVLKQKTDSVRGVMDGAIYTAARIADATPNLNPTKQLQRTAPIQRSQFSAETNRAMLSELVKNLELARITLDRETPLLEIVDHPILPLEKKGFGKLKGLVLGGFLFGFLVVIFLSIKLMLKNGLKNE